MRKFKLHRGVGVQGSISGGGFGAVSYIHPRWRRHHDGTLREIDKSLFVAEKTRLNPHSNSDDNRRVVLKGWNSLGREQVASDRGRETGGERGVEEKKIEVLSYHIVERARD